MRKIHGRPRLPWWVYIGYFLLALYASIFHAIGSEMPQQTVKINEDSLARAIVKAMKTMEKDELADEGRFGDSELAHVNPEEKAMLKARGGAGTTNPRTGLREFYEADAFGGSSLGDAKAGAEASAPGSGLGDMGGPNSANIGDAFSEGQDLGGAKSGANAGGGFSGGLSGTIDDYLSPTKPSWAAPSGRLAYELASLLGNTLGKGLNNTFGGNARPQDAPSLPNQDGGDNRGAMSELAQVQPGVTPAPAYMRPQAIEPPANLGMQGMSDIQKRTMMATYGSQGAQSQYRTPEAMRAYGNLIARSLIGDNNQITGNETGTLPIEDQYLRQVFGIQKPNSAQSLLDALKPYWSQ
jgi:hypothetical protein